MDSLTDVYQQVAAKDADLEKQAAELYKQAEEEDAAGRIMARGFADELAKLAEPAPAPAGGYQTGGGNMGQNFGMKPRSPTASATAAKGAGFSADTKPGGSKAPAMPKPAANAAAPKPAATPRPQISANEPLQR